MKKEKETSNSIRKVFGKQCKQRRRRMEKAKKENVFGRGELGK